MARKHIDAYSIKEIDGYTIFIMNLRNKFIREIRIELQFYFILLKYY